MFFESIAVNASIVTVLVIALTLDYITKFFRYWYLRYIPYKKPVPGFGSDFERVVGISSTSKTVRELYKKHNDAKYIGYFKSRIPELIVKDPDTLKLILSTNFDHFQDRGLCLQRSSDLCLRNNLFYCERFKWSALREHLESYFVSEPRSLRVNELTEKHLFKFETDINTNFVIANILDEVICDFLLGVSSQETTDIKEFKQKIVALRKRLLRPTRLDKYKNYLKTVFPSLYVFFSMDTVPKNLLKSLKNSLCSEILANQQSDSFIKSLIETQNTESTPQTTLGKTTNNNSRPVQFNHDMIVSQICSMLMEGYVPCYNTIILTLYELAKNPDIQQSVRATLINSNINEDGQVKPSITLDNVINEILRLYPTYSVLQRICIRAYKIPETDILIDRGVTVVVPVESLHRDPNFFKEPETFSPSRFSEEESKHPSFAFIPFGAGPRGCIGEQLARSTIKAVVSSILLKRNLEQCPKTPGYVHLKERGFSRVINRDVWLRLSPLDKQKTSLSI